MRIKFAYRLQTLSKMKLTVFGCRTVATAVSLMSLAKL